MVVHFGVRAVAGRISDQRPEARMVIEQVRIVRARRRKPRFEPAPQLFEQAPLNVFLSHLLGDGQHLGHSIDRLAGPVRVAHSRTEPPRPKVAADGLPKEFAHDFVFGCGQRRQKGQDPRVRMRRDEAVALYGAHWATGALVGKAVYRRMRGVFPLVGIQSKQGTAFVAFENLHVDDELRQYLGPVARTPVTRVSRERRRRDVAVAPRVRDPWLAKA